jgi:hypothetical protein
METLIQQTEQLAKARHLVCLIYGQASGEIYGRVLESTQDFLRFQSEFTGDIMNVPWAHVEAIIELQPAG